MLSTDTPIQKASEDRLGRVGFVKALAKTLSSFAAEDSFVVGIHGKWGSGKSSILNLLVEQISQEDKSKPEAESLHVMRFNPWNFSDQNQLIFQFLKQFGSHLRGDRTDYRKLLDSLAEYSEALAPPLQLLPYGHLLSSGVKIGIKGSQKLFGAAKDIDGLFQQITETANHLKRRTLVLIDDIDRLSAGETRQIFQLVKLTARFPYVVYVLAFDRQAVATALEKDGLESGAEYLEKIVQVAFDIPPVSDATLTSLINTSIDDLLKQYEPPHFDSVRYGNLFYGGLRRCFRSVRDVRRFLNGLEFGFGLIGSELNAVDFIGIEALRTFYPAIFNVIRANKETFSGHVDALLEHAGAEKYTAAVDKLLATTNELTDSVKDMLIELFPKLTFAYGRTQYGHEWETEWEKSYRVATRRYFDAYFALALGESEVSIQEVGELIASSADESRLAELFWGWKTHGKLQNGIETARHRFDEIPRSNLAILLRALITAGDLASDKGALFAGQIPEYWSVRWAIFDVMGALKPEQRVAALKEAYKQSSSIKTMVNVVVLIEQSKNENASKYAEFSDKDLSDLKAIVVERIHDLARNDGLLYNPALPTILAIWKQWGGSEEAPKNFLSAHIETDDHLITFLDSFIYQTHASSGRVVETKNRLSMKSLSEWMDLNDIPNRLNRIAAERLDPGKQEVLKVVRSEIDRFRAKGVPPEQFDGNRLFD